MEYKLLNQIRDTYPGNSDTIHDSYSRDGEQTKLTGLYPDNFIKFSTIPITDIVVGNLSTNPNISFRFIVQFQDGDHIEEWTSASFLRDLQNAHLENNPYFTKDKVTIARIDYRYLKSYWQQRQFKVPEDYAEVVVRDTIESKEDIILHINWLVDADNSNEELREVHSFGNWSVETTELLGFDHSAQMESLQTGTAIRRQEGSLAINPTEPRSNISINLSEPRGTVTAVSITETPTDINPIRSNTTTTTSSTRGDTSTSSTRTTTTVRTRSGTNFWPFNTAGRHEGETRTSESGDLYTWYNNQWNKN